jgi:pyrroloquinoline-quinone synthase
MNFKTYKEIETAIWAIVEEEIVQSPFMQSLRSGEWNSRQIAEFALQYSYYSRNFPRVLGAAIAAVEPEDDWWVSLVDNLWDEAGRGNPKSYHSRLYHSFLVTAAPGIPTDDRYVPAYPVGPGTYEAVNSFLAFLRNATSLEAMAAIGFGSELFAGRVMGLIGEGLAHPNYNKETKINTTFWAAHADTHEPRHYELCKNVLTRFTSPDELERMYRAGAYITRSEARFYDSIYERMKSLS